MEEERKALLKREQAASRMKDEFLATLSHELRTPLNAILGWASLLRTRKFDADATARAIETIERNAKAQTQIIEDLLDISRIIRGDLRLNIHPVNLVPLLDAAIDAVTPAATVKNISLEFLFDSSLKVRSQEPGVRSQKSHVRSQKTEDRSQKKAEEQGGWGAEEKTAINFPPAPLPPCPLLARAPLAPSPFLVLGDANRLQQIIWNLLTNAIKFTPNGGKVEVRLSVEDQIACIEVMDTGQGISPEFLPFVFDYFRQADSSPTRSQGGLGLGLAIVRQLVEMHGGTVYAESQGDGQGATFTVKIPLLEMAGVAGVAGGEKPITTDQLPLKGLRILVVEDEVDIRDLLEIVLADYGAKVVATSSAAEAKCAIASFEPDIIISDIAMPDSDGYQLMRQLRSLGKQMPASQMPKPRKQLVSSTTSLNQLNPLSWWH